MTESKFIWVAICLISVEIFGLTLYTTNEDIKLIKEITNLYDSQTRLQKQIATFQKIHICEDRSHETCDGDCDCDGIACDTL